MKITLPPFVSRHRWKLLIGGIAVLLVGGIIVLATRPKQPEYVTAQAKQSDLRQTVEAVGTVISEHDLKLQFPSAGVVLQVYVKEGDTVKVGQTLVSLRAGSYAADISSAAADVQSAQAQLKALQEGSRPEDIAIVEADVLSKRSALETAKTSLKTAEDSLNRSRNKLDALHAEASVSLAGTVGTSRSAVTEQLTILQNALSRVIDVFNNNTVQDAIIKSNSANYNLLQAQIRSAQADMNAVSGRAVGIQSIEEASRLLSDARLAASGAADTVSRAFDIIAGLSTTSSFQTSDQEGYKTTLSTQRTNAQGAIASLDLAQKTVGDAAAGYMTRIATEEANLAAAQGARDKASNDIATYQAALQSAEAQLALKRAPARQTDIDAAQARVRQAYASLQRARALYQNNLLIAPISGTVTAVNVKAGEITPQGPVITMLGDTPFRVEMFVSEIDIPKVQLSQTGSIELDAFRGTHFQLHVSEVDRAATDKDGVSKYRIKLDFLYPHTELKIGMTGDAEIVTGLRQNVVTVPARAILENDDDKKTVRVQKEDGTLEEREVSVGMEGEGGDTEISVGVNEGETVIVLVKK